MTKAELQIDFAINNFNFDVVYKTMVALDWHWHPMNRVPTIGEMREFAEKLLQNAYEERGHIASGGFHALYDSEDDGFTLLFSVEEVYVYENC